jgi:hypothetical protein
MEVTKVQSNKPADSKSSFSSLELEKAKQDLKSNPCLGVDVFVYDGVPNYVKERSEKLNELYNQAQKSLDLYA